MSAKPRKTRRSNRPFIGLVQEAIEIFLSQVTATPFLVPSEQSIDEGTPQWGWKIKGVHGTYDLALAFPEATSFVCIFANQGDRVLVKRARPYCLRGISPADLAAEMKKTVRVADACLQEKLVAA